MRSKFIRQLTEKEFKHYSKMSSAPQKNLADISDSCLSEKDGVKVVRLNYTLNRGNALLSLTVNLDEIEYEQHAPVEGDYVDGYDYNQQ